MRKLSWPLLFILLFCGCTVPQYIWHQEDMEAYSVNQPALEKKVLIASRQSEFKSELVQRITDAFKDKDVYINVIGIDMLNDEDARIYNAVVIINTSMAWAIDRKVEQFLDNYGELNSIIVLTTSDGGDVLPDLEGRNIDAISSASVKEQVDPVSENIIQKIEALL